MLKKNVLGKIRGEQFFYINLRFFTRLVPDCYSVFLLISQSPFHGESLPLYMLGSKYLGTNVLEL